MFLAQSVCCAALQAIFSGSFTALPKYASQKAAQQQAPVPRPITAWWLSLGLVCASSVLALVVPQALSWWGLMSGLLWVWSIVGRVACIETCGMCTGNATPDIATLITAWAYDELYNQVHFTCNWLGVVGLLLLALCLVSIYVLEQQGHVRRQLLAELQQAKAIMQQADGHMTEATTAVRADDPEAQELYRPLIAILGAAAGSEQLWRERLQGLLMGVFSGLCAGLSQLPFKMVSPGKGGLHFLLSASLGMFCFATLNVVVHRVVWLKAGLVRSVMHPQLHTAAMAPWGMAGGAVLLAGMVSGILAGSEATLGYSVAKLVSGGTILVSGAWGVLLFHELRSLLQVLFWLLSLQTLGAYAVIIGARIAQC